MRVGIVVASGLGAFLAAACSAVPDLRFGDLDDAGTVSVLDSSLPAPAPTATGTSSSGVDAASAPPKSTEDASVPPSSGEDASTLDAADASPPPPPENDAASSDPCPGNAPKGNQCCQTVVCRPGGIDYCDCSQCEAHCASVGACCMNRMGIYTGCATSVAACPAP